LMSIAPPGLIPDTFFGRNISPKKGLFKFSL
jgi:hypothetical protein